MARIAVVGGGAAGLNAARKLNELGQRVTVFEKAAFLGGRARSEVIDGCVVDTGAQLFGSGFRALFEFADGVQARSLLVRSPGRDAVWRGGRAHAITYGNVASMVTSSALPATLKLKLATRYVPFLLRHGQLDPGDPCAHGGDRLEGESVAEWGQRELGADFVELLAYPLLGAYYGSTPEHTTVVLYHALARAGLDVSVYGIAGGTGRLFDVAADHLQSRGVEIERGVGVEHVASAGSAGVTINGDLYDGAVLAVPPSVASGLCQFPEQLRVWLNDVQFARSAVLALVLKERIAGEYFGLSIPRRSSASDIVALCIQQQKLPGLVPLDRSLLIALGAPSANEQFISDPAAGVERMINAIEVVLPGTRAQIAHAKLYRHRDGYPVFYPGYLQHLKMFPAYAVPRVMLAGDYLVSPTIEGALRSGERAALRLYDQVRGL